VVCRVRQLDDMAWRTRHGEHGANGWDKIWIRNRKSVEHTHTHTQHHLLLSDFVPRVDRVLYSGAYLLQRVKK
jgi:hypothetical protein